MKHQYIIEGMTCQNCVASVKNKLSALPEIKSVEIDLVKKTADISMSSHLSVDQLQNALPRKYEISKKQTSTSSSYEKDLSEPSKWVQLRPLFMILGYIAVASILLNRDDWDWSGFMADFMGLFFIVFSFFKLLDLSGFTTTFAMYDPIAKRISAYGWIYPFIETGLGLMFLMRFEITIALIITLVILTFTTIGVTKTLLSKRVIKCACLGTALNLPMTEATFIENAIMIVMSIAMLAEILY